MEFTKDTPTSDEKLGARVDVVDELGTRYDTLYPDSFSAEGAYQMGRFVGNVTYPSGGEIRFVARALRDYGNVLNRMWPCDKERTHVWAYPPGVRKTSTDGATPEEASEFSAKHRITGWVMIGDPGGSATWDEICDAIWQYKKVICAIPIYENYREMEGGDGTYPNPRGPIIGYHAQLITGYCGNEYLDIEHSWGRWCGQHGKLPYQYFQTAKDESVWLVGLDNDEPLIIASQIYTSIAIFSNVPAVVAVNGVITGNTPLKIAIEKGHKYDITVSAGGYTAQTRTVDDSSQPNQIFELEPSPQPKNWLELLIDFIVELIRRLKK
jgi:hypothetical protein